MVTNRRKKSIGHRGHKTHGWGSKKKRRGSGHRGGRGNAGTGKRADTKKPSIWKERYFGKFGFTSKTPQPDITTVNVGYIEEHINKYISQKLITKEGTHYVIDLSKIGYNKLLGDGRVSLKLKISTPYASKSAIEKIKKAGGEVTGILESKPATKSNKAS